MNYNLSGKLNTLDVEFFKEAFNRDQAFILGVHIFYCEKAILLTTT